MSYSHLNIDQRHLLYQLQQQQKLSQSELGKLIGCSQSTISRELRRNKNFNNLYLPDTAQQLSDKRRQESKREFSNISEETIQSVKNGLKQRYSPEQIAGRLKREKKTSVSHETIYKMIYKNHQECGEYAKYLR
jgi:IS30 family transposase